MPLESTMTLPSRPAGITRSRSAAAAAAILFAGVAAVGWLYLLRHVGALDIGPRLRGALPLEQLAGSDSQPFLRMAAAWLPAGAVIGVALAGRSAFARSATAAAVTCAILLLSGAASDAVANATPVLSRLLPQLALPALWAAVALAAAAAALSGRRR